MSCVISGLMSRGRERGGSSGTSRLHAIKARLYLALQEKRRDTRRKEDSPGDAASHAELCGKAVWVGDTSATLAEF